MIEGSLAAGPERACAGADLSRVAFVALGGFAMNERLGQPADANIEVIVETFAECFGATVAQPVPLEAARNRSENLL